MERLWLRSACDEPLAKTGEQVVQNLRANVPEFSIVFRQPRSAVATTDPSMRRMLIAPHRLVDWQYGDRGPLVNTLVHEMTHLIPNQDGDAFVYRDSGHGASCPDAQLVSYQAGDVAEASWRSARGAE